MRSSSGARSCLRMRNSSRTGTAIRSRCSSRSGACGSPKSGTRSCDLSSLPPLTKEARMKKYLAAALAALSLATLAGCGGQNKNEREADKITRAIVANDVSPVMKDFDPTIKGQITRVRVAELSDQLNADGPYQ